MTLASLFRTREEHRSRNITLCQHGHSLKFQTLLRLSGQVAVASPYNNVIIMTSGSETFLTLNSGTSTPTSQMSNGSLKAKGIVVFSGGSAANNLVDVFKTVREDKKCPLSYVIPISDNGGSSSELIRVFGGPGT